MTDFDEMINEIKKAYLGYDPKWKCTAVEYLHYKDCPKGNIDINSCAECMRIDKLLEESGFK